MTVAQDIACPYAVGMEDEDRKLVMTLGVDAARYVRAAALRLDTSNAEVVRRGLTLLDFHLSLEADEELCIRRGDTLERVRIAWPV